MNPHSLFFLSAFRRTFLGFIFALSLIVSLPLDLYGTSCSSCQKETWFLKDQADQITSQNLKEVYRQEFGHESSMSAAQDVASHSQPQLYIFVSLSMPMAGLIDLGKQAQTYGAVLVLRGLVEGSYRKTALKLQTFIEQTQAGMIVDPLLFRQYGIQTVPTIVLTSPGAKAFDRIRGFIPLKTALEQIMKQGEQKDIAAALLKTGEKL